MKRIYCPCCSRQISSNPDESTNVIAPSRGAISGCFSQIICGDCSQGIDDAGILLGEQGYSLKSNHHKNNG